MGTSRYASDLVQKHTCQFSTILKADPRQKRRDANSGRKAVLKSYKHIHVAHKQAHARCSASSALQMI